MAHELPSLLVSRLHREAQAARWGLGVEDFGRALARSVHHAGPAADAVESYLTALHLEDLALAAACIEGAEAAWEHFVQQYRSVLHRAADAIDPTGGARELADALYADLYGTVERGAERRSLLEYFHGRSTLATWLRAVLARRHVDRLRATRRTEPLPDDIDDRAGAARAAALVGEREGFVTLMRKAVNQAVARLAPRDRLRLSCYYAEDLTLAQIGRVLGEHEATVSRHLARARQAIRQDVERHLAEEAGLDRATMTECFSAVVEDAGTVDVADWLGTEPARKIARAWRSKE